MKDPETVTGVGGAFVFSEDPARLAAWYTRHLGIDLEGSQEFGAFYWVYVAAVPALPGRRAGTTLSIMKARFPTARPLPPEEPESMYGDQPFMVNLRVNDLDALVARLASGGVGVIARMDEPYGRFAWVRDADGNRVELYEPVVVGEGASP